MDSSYRSGVPLRHPKSSATSVLSATAKAKRSLDGAPAKILAIQYPGDLPKVRLAMLDKLQ